MSEPNTGKPYCSFCAKSADEVLNLVAGPKVWICNECIDLCALINAEHRGRSLRGKLLERELTDILKNGT